MMIHDIFQLSDPDLTAEVARLARHERAATVALVVHLAVFDKRRLYLGAAYPSLFAYCRGVLKLSEHEAYHRIVAARAGRAFPLVFEMLNGALLNLTTVRLVAPHLTTENHQDVLTAACGKSKREVKELVAARFPQADVPASVRPVKPSATPIPPLEPQLPQKAVVAPPMLAVAPPTGPSVPPPPPDPVRPLSVDRYEIRFTAGAATRDKLRMAQDLLRHVIPDGDPAQVFDRALDALVEELLRKKFAATPRPRPRPDQRPSENTRHIPAEVKRTVWARDGGRCGFEGKGRRCEERGFLEFHHLKPFAAGGAATTDNIALRCRAHNAHEAELFYGRGKYNGSEVKESGAAGWVTESGTRSGPSWLGMT
jgi:hypothetical protein